MLRLKKTSEKKTENYLIEKFGPIMGAIFLFILEVVQIVLISVAIIVPVRYFLIQPFLVKGASMEPTYHNHEYLIVDEISYRFSEPDRGDVIVFRYPRDPSQFFIKRVIGLPGETVEVSDGGITLYNDDSPDGVRLNEDYLVEGENTMGHKRTVLGPDEYFVFGDNRNASLDSRSFGPVRSDLIIGKAWLRGWPITKFSTFDSPDYNL